jgi:hypothetical protein
MATVEGMRENSRRNQLREEIREEEWKKEVKKNPLLKLGLGDLVQEAFKLYSSVGQYTGLSKKEVPKKYQHDYNTYLKIIKELNVRGAHYLEDYRHNIDISEHHII